MTIKEFSRLCGCNPQTLRYYDHVDLLKRLRWILGQDTAIMMRIRHCNT